MIASVCHYDQILFLFSVLDGFFYSLSHYYFSDEDDVSSHSAKFQQLTIDSHDQEASHEEDRPAVVIPNHLLIHTEECSQLSFGSFGGFGSRPLSNNAEETSDVAPQIEHSDARYSVTTDFFFQNFNWFHLYPTYQLILLVFAEMLSSMEMNILEVQPMEIWSTHLLLEIMMSL